MILMLVRCFRRPAHAVSYFHTCRVAVGMVIALEVVPAPPAPLPAVRLEAFPDVRLGDPDRQARGVCDVLFEEENLSALSFVLMSLYFMTTAFGISSFLP